MGADGGTIPKRCELVRNKKKREKVDKNVENASKMKNCQLSNQPLRKPVIACRYGRLYNKEAILEGLLSKTLSTNEVTKHIKSRSDFKELRLSNNKDYKGDGPDKGCIYKDYNDTKWVCPITALPMNGTNIFKVNFLCGCVVSEKAYQETKATSCLGCSGPMEEDKMVMIYPDDKTLAIYKERAASEIKAKKAKKAEKKADDALFTIPQLPGASTAPLPVAVVKPEPKPSNPTTNGTETNDRKRKLSDKNFASIQDNPNVSSAVKSMFTTSSAAKRQPKQHWITHNPLYF